MQGESLNPVTGVSVLGNQFLSPCVERIPVVHKGFHSKLRE